jgi:hypothetical protein
MSISVLPCYFYHLFISIIVLNFFFLIFFFSLLELFAGSGAINETFIENLTQEDIIKNLNNGNKSGVFLIEKDFNRFLGGIERNSTGYIIGAKATYINWFSEANLTAATLEKKSDPSRQGMGLDENVKTTTPLRHSDPKLIIPVGNCWVKLIHSWGSIYRKVVSSNMSRLETHAGLFRVVMKGIFDAYVL